MLAHEQGGIVKVSKLAGSLGIDGKAVRHYMDLLEGLYLLRTPPAWSRNAGKRLATIPQNIIASHYRTQARAEVDLVLENPDGEIHAIEIKRTLSPNHLFPSDAYACKFHT